VPNLSLTIGWDAPNSDGCLSILSYSIERDGLEHKTNVHQSAVTFTDDITVAGAIGTEISYRVKAVNYAGSS